MTRRSAGTDARAPASSVGCGAGVARMPATASSSRCPGATCTSSTFVTQPLYRDDSGATAAECGLVVIAAVIVRAVAALGSKLTTVFNNISTSV